ncbi:MAG: cyclic nucleotide-binding domain-containing protein [Candidatus Firestonebacteria bacterium]
MFKMLISRIFQGKDADSTYAILKNISIFKDLTWIELKKLETIIHERTYAPEEVIFYEGEPGAGMYIIKKGAVAIIKKSESKETKIGQLKDGEFFGELSLLDEFSRSATAKAIEKTEILGFFRPDLLGLIKRDPKLGSKILLVLAKMIGERLRITTTEKVKVL